MNIIQNSVDIFINKKHSNEIMDFAKKVSMTTNYSDCGQNNYNLKVYQHYVGKLGELAVWLYLRDSHDITKPDFKIYNKNCKSWDSDLKVNDTHISIKTQDITSAKRFGLSWTFQHIKNGRKDSSINHNPLVIPTMYDNTYHDEIKVSIFPSLYMKDITFGEPKKLSLKGKKLIMYAKDNYKSYNQWVEKFKLTS